MRHQPIVGGATGGVKGRRCYAKNCSIRSPSSCEAFGIVDRTENTISHTLTTPPSAHDHQPRVTLLVYHRGGSRLIELYDGQSVVVGRARPADVAIPDASLSRQHGRFEFVDQSLWVSDLDSTNGTRVNRRKIKKRTRVSTQDTVQMGAVTVAAHVLSPEEQGFVGLESHDRLMSSLGKEIERCATFKRRVALLMIEARKGEHLSGWIGGVQRLLRSVDVAALYGPTRATVCLVEAGRDEACALAELVSERKRGQPQLYCGVATYPDSGVSADELVEAVRRALRTAGSRNPYVVADNKEGVADRDDGAPLIISQAMRDVYNTAERVADAVVPILITGETGTGKEVLARHIHQLSARRRKPLRAINCAAIPAQLVESVLFGHERGAFTGADRQTQGVFEQAQGGTVLLDEVGELSPAAQAALLRVLETKRIVRVSGTHEIEVDVRLLAATNRDLEAMCDEGSFRRDLLYRLNTMVLHLSALRERRESIFPLAERFMRAAAKDNGVAVTRIDDEARALLERYSWPGNVRELRNAIERAVLIAQDKTITRADLPDKVRRGESDVPADSASPSDAPPLPADDNFNIKDRLARYEAELLLDALKRHDFNQTRTAEALDMPLRTLVHKIKKFGLKKHYDID
ncbi:MAG: sigma 54-interacting transcriptional regulator [Myxococcales bacterium]|nr:sigma 54-interacting transcriptional regulator [Myxococcales bacterium]